MKRFIAFIVGVLVVLPHAVGAASVSPALIELETFPDGAVTEYLTIYNSSDLDRTYYLDTMTFTAAEDGVTPRFEADDTEQFGVADWLTVPSESVVIPAQSQKRVDIHVHIPASTPGGSYYAAVTVSGSPSELVESNGATIEAKTAVLILMTVDALGRAEKIELLDFTDQGSSVRSQLNEGFTLRLQNQGNVHVQPIGSIQYQDVFGRIVDTTEINAEQGRVLPGTTRVFVVEPTLAGSWLEQVRWQFSHVALGPMTAKLTAHYGDTQTIIHTQSSFVFVPWQMLSVLAALLVGLSLIYRFFKR